MQRGFFCYKKDLIVLSIVNYGFCFIFVKSIGFQFVVVPLLHLILKLLNKIEYMCKKSLIVMLFVAVSSFVVSCIDKNYDLANKEIATDVKIEGNSIAVPIGSLKSVVLDSLIVVSDIEMLEKGAYGIYCITMDSTFTVEESIDSITFNIEPIEYNATVGFDKANIDTIHIHAANMTPATFSSPNISVEDLNEKLPRLESDVKTDIEIPGLENLLSQLANSPLSSYTYRFDKPLEVTTGLQSVPCKVDYLMHHDIETIRSIKLGTAADTIGTPVNVVVTNPKVLQDCAKEINFRIDFPEIFTLALNEDAEQPEKYKIDGHSVCLDGFEPKGETSLFSFYITDVKGVDRYIENGRIWIDDSIKYAVDYKVDGELELRKDMKVEEFAFDVAINVQLGFLDATGKTKDVRVDFEPVEMAFGGDFGNLEHIDTINYVEFDEERSLIKFETSMDDGWLDAFELKEGYALKVSFPEQLEISPDYSDYEGKDKEIIYNEEEHAFYVNDFRILANTHWNIAPKRLTLNLPVVDDSCHIDDIIKAEISIVNQLNPTESGYFYLAGREMDSMMEALGKLNGGDKEAHFRMLESNLKIKNAVVHTKVITSSLNSETDFNINEKIPGEIARIEHIGFKEDVLIKMELDITGMENVNTDIELDVDITLPSFLQLKPYDKSSGIDVYDGVLSVNTSYNPATEESLELKLLCTGIDFMNEEFGYSGLLPKDSIDGNSYISYSSNIVVDGEASIHGVQFHSEVLDNDISFDVKLEIGEISVKTFHGIYSAEIEGVDEKIDLDLGEELEFLREDGNSVILADPQIEFVLTNPVGIPVDVHLRLFGNDENGDTIAESEIVMEESILPAMYDKKNDSLIPVETKLFITTDTANNSKAGYKNVQIPNLANLLKRIPYSVNIDVEPVVRTADVTHYVDIEQPIKLDGAYSVVVPLRFDDLHLCYCDTIDELDAALGETVKMFSNVSVNVKMDIVNTIPLGLSLKAAPLDADGKVIDDIEIDELKIAAGNGETLLDANGALNADLPVQSFNFAIKSKSGDISSLDGLAFSLEAASDHTTGSAAIKGEQGIKISNIVFEVSGDIETDLKDLGL